MVCIECTGGGYVRRDLWEARPPVKSIHRYQEEEADEGRRESRMQHAERMLDTNAKTLEYTADVAEKQKALDEHVETLISHYESIPEISNHLKRTTENMEQ